MKRQKQYIKILVICLLGLLCYRWFTKDKARIETVATTTKIPTTNERELELFQKKSGVDFELLGDRLRVYKKVFDQVSSKRTSRVDTKTKKQLQFLEKMEKVLFPWIRPSFTSTLSMRSFFKGQGIVICAADRHTQMVVSLVRMIRTVHNCQLPIEIFYIGKKDLNPSNRKILEAEKSVKTRDILTLVDNRVLELEGFAVKVFALLMSSFRQAMLIDADVIFLQSPETIFNHSSFEQHHAIFFRDRTLYSPNDEMIKWFHDILPRPPSEFSQEFRIFQGKTKHEQESGVVLVDKWYSLPGLLGVCSLNAGKYRQVTYKRVYGDKETFWLGFEATQQPYYFYPFLPGTTGVSKQQDGENQICSRQILHLDHDQKPLWLNGGITEYKMDKKSSLAEMKEWMAEPGRWHLEAHNLACLYTDRKPTPLTDSTLKVISQSGNIFLQNR